MSVKSGTAPQVLTLPSGGGALQGIGETFTADPSTGSGKLTIPIGLPDGRNAFQPALALSYDSTSGNSPFGLGWSMQVPSITRKTARGVPRYPDNSGTSEPDTFLLSGFDDLVDEGSPAEGVTRYRPRTEASFTRVERHRNNASDTWQTHSKDGLTSIYGALSGAGTATIADPVQPPHIFSWLLSETRDPLGNRIIYEYLRDRDTIAARTWDQLYLNHVKYVDVTTEDRPSFLITVNFIYEERPDLFSNHRAGFEIRTRLRCRRIEIHTHAGADQLTRSYELEYLDNLIAAGKVPASTAPANGVSLLSGVTVVGHDENDTQALPPLAFGYTAPEPHALHPVKARDGSMPGRSLADDDLDVVSLFANGLPDIVELGKGSSQYWRNLGAGTFDAPQQLAEIPAHISLSDPGVQLADLNGNGRADLLTLKQGGYFPQGFHGQWQQFVEYTQSPSVTFGDSDLRLVDLDGDGITDALRTSQDFELFYNDPISGWHRTEIRPRGTSDQFPDVSFSDPHVKTADVSGDGLQDIVLVDQGRIDYWPYLGRGHWAPRISMDNPPNFPTDVPGEAFDPLRVFFGDIDGDGAADIIYVGARNLTYWINRGGQSWSGPTTIENTPPVQAPDAVRVVDLLGTGVDGVLWSADSTSDDEQYVFLEITSGPKTYLLSTIDNHMGASTSITYSTSTVAYQRDEAEPATRWGTPLPFPVHVVDTVAVTDHISRTRTTTNYRYHHGYWDGAEREFRGFGRVDQLDSERSAADFNPPADAQTPFDAVSPTQFSPPLLTRTWFHVGPTGDESGRRTEANFIGEYWPGDAPFLPRPAATVDMLNSLTAAAEADALRTLRGSVLRTELYALDGSEQQDLPFTVTEYQYGIRQERSPSEDGTTNRGIYFPHLDGKRTTQWDRGNDPMTQLSFTDDYDNFGMSRRQIILAVPRGRDFRNPGPTGDSYLGAVTTTRYAQRGDGPYIADRVASVTTQEIINDGAAPALTVRDVVVDGAAELKLTGQTRNYYDGEPFIGLALGAVGNFGALVRAETLAFTDQTLKQAYQDSFGGSVLPPYLKDQQSIPWTDEYPQEFRDLVRPFGGYVISPTGDGESQGFYIQHSRYRYDFHTDAMTARGLRTGIQNTYGGETRIGYDDFNLLPVIVTDPAGMTKEVSHNYRFLSPHLITDENGNRTAYTYTPLGLLEGTAVMGKSGEDDGDSVEAPGVLLVYDFRHQPISVRTIQRLTHAADTAAPADRRDETIETVEYTDGFGRLLQTRVQAEDILWGDLAFGQDVLPQEHEEFAQRDISGRSRSADPNVVVTGWQVYDNKGRVIEKYEPFYATGWDFARPGETETGQHVTMRYDARGRILCTVHPDGSEERVTYGVPTDVTDPDRFTPTPWELYSYDANDNAGRTSRAESLGYQHHWNTPASSITDALGRTIRHTVRSRNPGPDSAVIASTTGFAYDLLGNLMQVTDSSQRPAMQCVPDFTGRPLRVEYADSGVRTLVPDASGNETEGRDSKGALILQACDQLLRPIRRWARDNADGIMALRERLEYGDGGNARQSDEERTVNQTRNLLGKVHRHFDESGLVTFAGYDFKNNVIDQKQRFIADETLASVFPVSGDTATGWNTKPFRIDWEPPAGTSLDMYADSLLDETGYETSASFDAVNRVTWTLFPADVSGHRSELRPRYNKAGALEGLDLDGQAIVERIIYNAAGQRTLIVRGNGILTRYSFDNRNRRLRRLRSERFTHTGELTYHVEGPVLQDLSYRYDLAGNMLELIDRTSGSGIRSNPEAQLVGDPQLRSLLTAGDALVRRFHYDPLYRLTAASGRECIAPQAPEPWQDNPRCGFPGAAPAPANAASLTKRYNETYKYDDDGNIVEVRHRGADGGTVQLFTLASGTNRIEKVTTGSTTVTYKFDDAGNLTGETTSRHFEWDHSNRMTAFRIQTGDAEPSILTHYLYDANGQRVKKLTRRQGGHLESVSYIAGTFEHHRWGDNEATEANNHLHLMDDEQRIAVIRRGPARRGDPAPDNQYHLSDHLGSSAVVLDAEGGFINREEYTPYGETSFGSFGLKRYRFTAKERDEESGFYYHGSRYYSPWLRRWVTPDPSGLVDGVDPYVYSRNNPLRFVDPTGREGEDPEKGILGHARDFAVGVWSGGKDTIVGAGQLARGAYRVSVVGWLIDRDQWEQSNRALAGTVGAIAQDPGLVWEGIKEPYVKAWSEGRPWEAIGRGTTEAAGFVLGGKGVDKIAKSVKVGKYVNEALLAVDAIEETGRSNLFLRIPAAKKQGPGGINIYTKPFGRGEMTLIITQAPSSIPGANKFVKTTVKYHDLDKVAMRKHPGSNSGTGTTLSIEQGGRRVVPDADPQGWGGRWQNFSTASNHEKNLMHIPIFRWWQ